MGDTKGTHTTSDTNTTNISSANGANRDGGDDPDHPPSARFRRVLDAEPAALSVLRRAFHRWLQQMRWPDDDAADLVMALNEAVANVIDHAYQTRAGDPPGQVQVLAELINGPDQRRHEGYRVRVTVTDSGRWRPIPTDPGYRGRGLRMMRACNAWLGVDPGPNGTSVTMISHPCLAAPTSGESHTLDYYRGQRRSA